jgi:hypothetical protein
MEEPKQTPTPPREPGPSPTPSPGTPTPEYRDWREQRRAEREARWEARSERWRRHGGRRSSLLWGCILILLGLVLFLQNAGIPLPLNWWAVFIFIPAFWSFVGAWDSYHDEGRLTRRAAAALVGGVLLSVLALVFLFNLAFSSLWPILLIVGGVALLLTGFVRD